MNHGQKNTLAFRRNDEAGMILGKMHLNPPVNSAMVGISAGGVRGRCSLFFWVKSMVTDEVMSHTTRRGRGGLEKDDHNECIVTGMIR